MSEACCDSFVSEIVPEVAPAHDTLVQKEGIMEPLAVIYIGGGAVTLIIILIILFLLFGRR